MEPERLVLTRHYCTWICARLRRGGIAALALTVLLVTGGVVAQGQAARSGLLLGKASLTETRSETELAPGVTLTRIVRGSKPARAARIGITRKGPWRIQVLTIDPARATGHVRATYGSDVVRTETTSALVRAAGAVAGVNGSFFSLTADPRHPGDPVGLVVHGGRVLSSPGPVASEAHFVLNAATNTARVARLSWRGALTHRLTGTTLAVGQVNIPPIVPSSCATLTDPTRCTRRGELITFTSTWAASTPRGPGAEVVLDGNGCVVRTALSRGTALAPGQSSVQATGRDTLALLRLVALGCLERTDEIVDSRGRPLALIPDTFVLTGRHRLLVNGQVQVPAGSGGLHARNPRTIAGVAQGRIMLVTIDGRSRYSVGATLREAAAVATSLGMTDAVNLDGGGSTTLSVNGETANRPSGGRERSVGDAVVYIANPWREEL